MNRPLESDYASQVAYTRALEAYWEWLLNRINTTPPQRPWIEPTGDEWFKWWCASPVSDETEAEIDFADFLIIAQAVLAKLKEKST